MGWEKTWIAVLGVGLVVTVLVAGLGTGVLFGVIAGLYEHIDRQRVWVTMQQAKLDDAQRVSGNLEAKYNFCVDQSRNKAQ